MIQNQARVGLPNTLHDEGSPNTLARMGAPVRVGGFRLQVGMFVIAVAAIMAALTVSVLLAR